jgi:hypothetical protein
MRIPYLFGPLPVIGDNARPVARRAAPFILSALINKTFSVAFRADFFSHLCALLVPPLSDQPAAQGLRRLVLLDRLCNRALLVGLIVDEADELAGVPRMW